MLLKGWTLDAAVFLLVVLLACGVLAVVRQLLLYPARVRQWRFTFSHGTAYRDARRTLRQARRARRMLHSKHRREMSDAKGQVKAAEKAARRRIQEVKMQRDERLRPGRGDPIGRLGDLRLFKHHLVFLKGDSAEDDPPIEDETIPLAGLKIESLPAAENTVIIVTRRDGTKRNATFPHRVYKEGQVLNFATLIHNEERKDSEFRGQAAEIDQYLGQVTADVAAEVDTARRHVGELHEAQRADPQQIQAGDAWVNQCQLWQAQTGRRARWWYP